MKEERDVMLLGETREAIRKELKKLDSPRDRNEVLIRLRDYVIHMDDVQACPQLPREKYYACTFAAFKYLRANRQLGRKVHLIDRKVLRSFLDIISDFQYHDGV